MVVSAHGLQNEGYYMCSTFASDQCLKNESDKLQVFLVVGLKNLERNTLWINLFRISNPNPNRLTLTVGDYAAT